MNRFVMTSTERNRRKRLRKERASGRVKGRRTDIPLSDITIGRSVRFDTSDGTKGA